MTEIPKIKVKTKNKIKAKLPKAKLPKEKLPKAKPPKLPKEKPPKPQKAHKTKNSGKVIVEITPPEKENEIYSDKLKHLIYKIKNQNNYSDTGIRFAWKN